MLNIKELVKTYPKSGQLLKNWTKKMLSNFQTLITGSKDPNINKGLELPEITDDMAEKALEGLVSINFRLLYDFFDENRVYSYVGFDVASGFVNNFTDKDYETRTEAEIEGFEYSFKTLESKL